MPFAANPQAESADLAVESSCVLLHVIHIHRRHLLLLRGTKADADFTVPWMAED